MLDPARHVQDDDRPTCPEDGTTLDLHQPDNRDPDRLLGTCRRCRAWFTVDRIGRPARGEPPYRVRPATRRTRPVSATEAQG